MYTKRSYPANAYIQPFLSKKQPIVIRIKLVLLKSAPLFHTDHTSVGHAYEEDCYENCFIGKKTPEKHCS